MKILTDKPSPQQVLPKITSDSAASSSFLDCLNANMHGLAEEGEGISQMQQSQERESIEGLLADADEESGAAANEAAAKDEAEQVANLAIDPSFLLPLWLTPVELKAPDQGNGGDDVVLGGAGQAERDVTKNGEGFAVAKLPKMQQLSDQLMVKNMVQPDVGPLTENLIDKDQSMAGVTKPYQSIQQDEVDAEWMGAELREGALMDSVFSALFEAGSRDAAQGAKHIMSKEADLPIVPSLQERSVDSMLDVPINPVLKGVVEAPVVAMPLSASRVAIAPRAEAIQAKIDSIELVRDGLSVSGAHQIRIKVTPEEWGPVVTHVRVSNNRAEVEIVTQNVHVSEAVKAQLGELKAQFAQSNIELVSVDVRESGGGASEQGDHSKNSAADSYWTEPDASLVSASKQNEKIDKRNKTLIDTYA